MTDLEKERKERYNKTGKGNFTFIVKNHTSVGTVESEFTDIGQVLHKIRLDLMTLANYPQMLNSKIEICVKLDDTKIIDHQHRKKGEEK